MVNKIILASKSKVRKKILQENGILCEVEPANVDEDLVKESLIKEGANPSIISKNLAELKANKVSMKKNEEIVLGADSVIDLNGDIISKPSSRIIALEILKKLNGKKHHIPYYLIHKKFYLQKLDDPKMALSYCALCTFF